MEHGRSSGETPYRSGDGEGHLNSPSTSSSFHEMKPLSVYHYPQQGPHPQYQQPPMYQQGMYSQPGMTADPHFRVAQWQQPYDSGVQSLQQSQAPSIMSIQSSCMSGLDPADLTDQQRQRFDHITNSLHGAAPQAVRELVSLLNDDNDAVVMKALAVLLNVAKRDADDKFNVSVVITSPDVVVALTNLLRERHEQLEMVRSVLITLFYISLRNQAVLVVEANEILEGDLLRRLVALSRQRSVHKYAIPILHSLLSCEDKQKKLKNIQMAVQEDLLDAMMLYLNDDTTTEKLQKIVVASVLIICQKNEAQAKIFLSRQGARRLVDILNKSTYEGLLTTTTKLLTNLSGVDNQRSAVLLIEAGVPQAAAEKLTHASSHLVKESAICLRCLSHVPTMQHQSKVIAKVLQLLGPTYDVELLLYAVDVLYNMCVQNSANKVLVSRGTAVQHLFELLRMYPAEMRDRERLEESILGLLCILCKNDHQLSSNTQANVAKRIHFVLEKLRCLRPKIIKVALQLLYRVASNRNLLDIMSQAYLENNVQSGLVGQVVEILRVACGSLQSNPIVEDVKVNDMMTSCFDILRLVSENPVMHDQVIEFLQYRNRAAPIPPLFALQQNFLDDRNMKKAALALIDQNVREQRVAELFNIEKEYFACLQRYYNADKELAQIARHACDTIMLGGDLPIRQQPSRALPPRVPSPMDDQGDVLPEDLSNLELNDNPFADVFLPTNPPHNSPPYPSPHHPRAPRYEPHYYQEQPYPPMPPQQYPQYEMYPEYAEPYRQPPGPYAPPSYPNYPMYNNYSPHQSGSRHQ